jgi:hypothetical protein
MPRLAAIVTCVALLVVACGDDDGASSPDRTTPHDADLTPDEGTGVAVRVDGTLEQTSTGWQICPGGFGPCWPVVDDGGLDLSQDAVAAEGTWREQTISLTTIEPRTVEPAEFPDPCEGEDLGPFDDGIAGGPVAIRTSTPDLAAMWFTSDQRTLVVVVNDEVDQVRDRLRADGHQGVCVADLGFEHSLSDLEAAQQEVADRWDEWAALGWATTSSTIDQRSNQVVASFDEIDQRLRDELAEAPWGALVQVDAIVEVLDGTVDDLALPTSGREVPITTQPRGAAGMGALGRFTLRYDVDGDCLWLETEEGDRVKPIWPAGTTALRDPFVVLDGRGQPIVAIGQEIETGGGFGQILPGSDDPTDCGATEVWVIAPGT